MPLPAKVMEITMSLAHAKQLVGRCVSRNGNAVADNEILQPRRARRLRFSHQESRR